jgi:2-dehydro-3-deoxygalactonokinase
MSATAKPHLIAVDWGTSNFRAALISPAGEIENELATTRGVSSFARGEFAPYLIETCKGLGANTQLIYLLAGMIGSREGLREAPYCPCPAGGLDLALALTWVIPQRIAIVPGLRNGTDDVMRGEESQVLGAAAVLGLTEALIVLPGTHSKWVSLEGGRIAGFSTMMTGEFYALLRNHSILAKSIAPEEHWDEPSFLAGVEMAMQGASLLHSAFSLRVKFLFNELKEQEASSYLSGLVIGEELAAMQVEPGLEVILVGNTALCERYALALQHLGAHSRSLGTQASWMGLHAIYQQIKL